MSKRLLELLMLEQQRMSLKSNLLYSLYNFRQNLFPNFARIAESLCQLLRKGVRIAGNIKQVEEVPHDYCKGTCLF